jgi:L-fuconolactonase
MIDAHHHFWSYNSEHYAWIDDSMKVIRKDFLPADFGSLLHYFGFEGSVLVQVNQNEEENETFLKYARENDFIKGVVGWIDLRDDSLEKSLEKYTKETKLKGFRHIVQGEPDGFLLQAEFIKGVKLLEKYNYTYDILIKERQLKEALHFIRQLPDNKLIIDHIAKPDIKNKSITRWSNYMKEISKHEKVYVKVSGMVTEADYTHWKKEDFYVYLDHVLEYFGTDRLVYGSDWPVCLVAADYGEQLDILQTYFSGLSEAEQRKIFGENARRFYSL